jgi:hypothetical protein
MADHSKRTGPAVEAHLFLLWLIPTIERFPKSHKFVLGDRVLNVGLDVLELLAAATFTRDRKSHLGQVNLGIDKLRFFLRMATTPVCSAPSRYGKRSEARLLRCMGPELALSRL